MRYNVEDYYKEKSCFADIARSQLFNNLTLLVRMDWLQAHSEVGRYIEKRSVENMLACISEGGI